MTDSENHVSTGTHQDCPGRLRVLLVDDQSEVRSALRLVLEHELELVVVGEVGAACDLAEAVIASRPDMVLVDWELPELNGYEMARTLRRSGMPVKMVAMSGRPDTRHSAVAAGADAFICKVDSPERLLETVRALRLAIAPCCASHSDH